MLTGRFWKVTLELRSERGDSEPAGSRREQSPRQAGWSLEGPRGAPHTGRPSDVGGEQEEVRTGGRGHAPVRACAPRLVLPCALTEIGVHQRDKPMEVHFPQLPHCPTPHIHLPSRVPGRAKHSHPLSQHCHLTQPAASLELAVYVIYELPHPRILYRGHLLCFQCFWSGLCYSFTDQITASHPH